MSLQETFKALADPTRRDILYLLQNHSMKAGEIADHFPFTSAAISRHLSVLKAADLIRDRREGKCIIYEINTSVLEEAILWMHSIQHPSQHPSADRKTDYEQAPTEAAEITRIR